MILDTAEIFSKAFVREEFFAHAKCMRGEDGTRRKGGEFRPSN